MSHYFNEERSPKKHANDKPPVGGHIKDSPLGGAYCSTLPGGKKSGVLSPERAAALHEPGFHPDINPHVENGISRHKNKKAIVISDDGSSVPLNTNHLVTPKVSKDSRGADHRKVWWNGKRVDISVTRDREDRGLHVRPGGNTAVPVAPRQSHYAFGTGERLLSRKERRAADSPERRQARLELTGPLRVPRESADLRAGRADTARRKSQLSGSHGEWTDTDDLDRARGGKGKGKANKGLAKRLKAVAPPANLLLMPPPAPDEPEEKVQPPEVRAHILSLAENVVVYDTNAPVHAIVNGQPFFVPFGARDRLIAVEGDTPVVLLAGSIWRLVDGGDPSTLGVLVGYKCVSRGHWTRIDYSGCYTVEECTSLADYSVSQLGTCGRWRTLTPIHFSNGSGFLSLQSQTIYEVYQVSSFAMKKSTGDPRTSQTNGVRSLVTSRFPDLHYRIINDAMSLVTWTKLCAMIDALANPVHDVAHVFTVDLPKFKNLNKILSTCAFVEYAAVATGRAVYFSQAKIPYVVYGNFKSVKGLTGGGGVVPGEPDAFLRPQPGTRFQVIRASLGVEFAEIVHAEFVGDELPRRADCVLPFFVDHGFEDGDPEAQMSTRFRSAGFVIESECVEGRVVVYDETATTLSDSILKRGLLAIGQGTEDEADLSHNQMLTLYHVKAISPDMYACMDGLLKGNSRKQMEQFLANSDQIEHEFDGLAPYTHGTVLPRLIPGDALLQKLGRRAAAAALVAKFDNISAKARFDLYRSVFVGGFFVLTFGMLVWQSASLAPGTLLTRFIMWGTVTVATATTGFAFFEYYSRKQVYTVDAGGFTHKYLAYPIFGSCFFGMMMAASRTHIKSKEYLKTLGRMVRAHPSWFLGEFATPGGQAAQCKLKKDEASKYGKCARFIVSCGWITLLTQISASYVKRLFSCEFDIAHVIQAQFTCVPVMPCLHEALYTLPKEVGSRFGMNKMWGYSDDQYAMLLISCVLYYICADASSADASVGPAITLGYLPAFYAAAGVRIPVETLIYNYVRAWEVRHPKRPRESFTLLPTQASMPSGDANTTLLQNIFTLMRDASFLAMFSVVAAHEDRDKKAGYGVFGGDDEWVDDTHFERAGVEEQMTDKLKRLVELSARSVGGISTVEVSTLPHKATLLKRTFAKGIDVAGKSESLVYFLCAGAILRNLGTYAGELSPVVLGVTKDVFDRMDLSARYERYVAGVIEGLKNEPSTPLLDVLRARFENGTRLCHLEADLRYKAELQAEAPDRSGVIVTLSEFCLRYDCPVHVMEDFLRKLRAIEYGTILRHRAVDHIMHVDYGTPLPDIAPL